ncbi:hypothetical protein H0H92_001367, partial [Tricholoma furcatifolium]
MSCSQLWVEVLKTNPSPSFSRKAIYQLWQERNSLEWKRDADEVISAKRLIEEASESNSGVEAIQVHSEEG